MTRFAPARSWKPFVGGVEDPGRGIQNPQVLEQHSATHYQSSMGYNLLMGLRSERLEDWKFAKTPAIHFLESIAEETDSSAVVLALYANSSFIEIRYYRSWLNVQTYFTLQTIFLQWDPLLLKQ